MPESRLDRIRIVLVVAMACLLVLAGCKPSLPDVPEPTVTDGQQQDGGQTDAGPTDGDQPSEGAVRNPVDPAQYVPKGEWEPVGSYAGTSGDAKLLTVLEPNKQYRFVCTVDPAPGSSQMLFAAWLEHQGQRLTAPLEVPEDSTGGFEFQTDEQIPQPGYRLVTATTGFVSWEVDVYVRK